tara:strand:- start:74 stop:643 length:570 start_codon:yes stop_codon:yes gene_type:complete
MIFSNRLVIFLVFFMNCGYYSYKGTLPVGISSISISSVKNNTSEYTLSNLINEKLSILIIQDNILDISDFSLSDSNLEIEILDLKESPEVYSVNEVAFGNVDQWKMEVTFNIKWKNLITGEIILNKKNKKWAMYNTSDLDMNNDNIDNDLDGFIDSEDSDEFGAPREGAVRIISNKISQQIITELISTW